jgi:beta-lactamase regulating signal transducer with metallopeptidase domain
MFSASGELSSVLGWTMVHLFWVIFVVYLIHRFIQFLLRRSDDRVRYIAALGMLLIVAGISLGLLVLPWVVREDLRLSRPFYWVGQWMGLGVIDVASVADGQLYHRYFSVQDRWWMRLIADYLEPVISWLGVIWIVGLVWHFIPWIRDFLFLIRLVSRSRACEVDLSDRAFDGIRGIVSGRIYPVRETSEVDGPCVTGWWKPVILLPLGLITQIRPDQLMCILSHELAHIRRCDFVINLFQTVVEACLFFHPCVKWLSNEIRILREACCDDIAIQAVGSSRRFAESLIAIEKLRPNPAFALGMSDASVPSRVHRLILLQGQKPQSGYRRFVTLFVSLVMLLMISAVPVTNLARDYQDQVRVAQQGMSRLILSELGLRRDNPELSRVLQTAALNIHSYRQVDHSLLIPLVRVASRGGLEDQILVARSPRILDEKSAKQASAAQPIFPAEHQIASLASEIFTQALLMPPGQERDQWTRAAIVLGAQEGFQVLPRLRLLIQHVRFGELVGCTQQVEKRLRRWVSIASYFQSVGFKQVEETQTQPPERLVELLDRFTYPYTVRWQIITSATRQLSADSPWRKILIERLRATGRQPDQQLVRLLENATKDSLTQSRTSNLARVVSRTKSTPAD